mmetsp:Transcript_3500/g.13578  ORF Transcript_3500/g.13578 Transcript_3500/m.13578 type:complete len:226 (+) Transcript_3500:188-865(+)
MLRTRREGVLRMRLCFPVLATVRCRPSHGACDAARSLTPGTHPEAAPDAPGAVAPAEPAPPPEGKSSPLSVRMSESRREVSKVERRCSSGWPSKMSESAAVRSRLSGLPSRSPPPNAGIVAASIARTSRLCGASRGGGPTDGTLSSLAGSRLLAPSAAASLPVASSLGEATSSPGDCDDDTPPANSVEGGFSALRFLEEEEEEDSPGVAVAGSVCGRAPFAVEPA